MTHPKLNLLNSNNFSNSRIFRVFVCSIFLFFQAMNLSAQNSVSTFLRTCNSTLNTIDFNIVIRNTSGNSTMILQSGAYGIDWDYIGTGGGTVSLAYIGGSQLNSTQTNFNSINTNIDPTSKSIRINAQLATSPSNGTLLPVNTDVLVGTFRITKVSGIWSAFSSPNFIFNLTNMTNKTSTAYTVYVNGSFSGTAAQLGNVPAVESPCNSMMLNSVCLMDPFANAKGPYSSCANVLLNGAVGGGATSGTWISPTGGTFTPGANSLNATYIPSSTDLTTGSVVLTLVTNNPNGLPCYPDSDKAVVTFISCDDGNGCTTDFCDQLGVCQHTAVNINDNNACTTDFCEIATGLILHSPVNFNDNNACTADACNPTTGVISHVSVNVNDNNACTIDACNPANGSITHTPVNTNDGNACTIDGCDPITGVFHTLQAEICGNGIDDNCNLQIDEGCCPPPAMPGTITTTGGSTRVCPGNTRTYTVPLVAGKIYTWTPPAGAVINSGQGTRSINVSYTAGFIANDSLRVVVSDSCGTSAQRKLLISRNFPSTPSAITGAANDVCNLSLVPYSITNVAGMTYAWSFTVASGSIFSGQGTNSVLANYNASFLSGSIRVTATNACGTSGFRSKVIRATPAAPTVITGSTSVCINQQGVPYSINPLVGSTSYTWTGPTGSQLIANAIVSPNNTITTTATNVTVNYATNSGTIRARGNNICGAGTTRSLTVTFVCRDEDISTLVNFDAIVYPNPTNGNYLVQFYNSNNEAINIEMIDLTGRVVALRRTNKESVTFDCSVLESGLYFLRVQQGDIVLNKQVVLLK